MIRHMKVRILTYNIKFHRAYKDLETLVKKYRPDFLCTQEIDIKNLHDKIANLQLAATTRVGTMGLATYANYKKFEVTKSESIGLSSVWYEHVNRQPRFRLQLMHVKAKYSQHRFLLANLHLANLLATNHGRRGQAKMLFNYVKGKQNNSPAIIAGDFNYPVFTHRLINIAKENEFIELGPLNAKQTHNNPFLKGRFDRVFVSSGLKESHYQVLPFITSDHTPVLVEIEI